MKPCIAAPTGDTAMTTVTTIRTESDYDAAIARVDELWGAKPGTPESDELKKLATLLGRYEEDADTVSASVSALTGTLEAITSLMEQRGL